MTIDIDNGQFFYDLFYQISFLVVFVILLAEGYRRKFPWSTWLLVIVTVRVFTVAGSKFDAITSDDLEYFIQNMRFPEACNKNLIVALAFGLAGIGISKLLLGVRYPILDAFAIAIPFGMAVQRTGCLMVGCCYGTETQLPWGIQYGQHAPAFLHQFFSNRIGLQNSLSLNIHPVPLYFMVSCLLIGVMLLLLRHYWKRPGNLTLFGLLLLSVSRFVIEFFRDPQSNGSFQGNYFLGLKIVQIICLIVVLILVPVIAVREKRPVRESYAIQSNHPLFNAFYLLMLSMLVYMIRGWFSGMEFRVILITLIPAALVVIYHLTASYYSAPVRISGVSLILLSFFLMSQTPSRNDSTRQGGGTRYKTVRFGFSSGKYTNHHDIGSGSGCERESEYQEFKQKYKLAGLSFSAVKADSLKVSEFGLNAYFGSHSETGLTSNEINTGEIIGINPFYKIDMKWFGGGVGVHLGSLKLTPASWIEEDDARLPETGTRKLSIYPQVYARLGKEKIVYISYHLSDQFPSPFPFLYSYTEIGSGFGLTNGFKAGLGFDYYGLMLKAKVPIQRRFFIEPLFRLNTDANSSKGPMFSVGFEYRFDPY